MDDYWKDGDFDGSYFQKELFIKMFSLISAKCILSGTKRKVTNVMLNGDLISKRQP